MNSDSKSVDRPLPEGIPNRFVFVMRADREVKKIRVLEGQLFVCQGCCCGRTERGMPALPLDEFKQQWKERGVRLRVHLTVTGCLGPCPLANVVLILFDGEAIWLHSINSPEHVTEIYDYLEAMLRAEQYLPPPGRLADCHFNRHLFDTAAGDG
ncbi:MAG TPA: (2Fe-2S) ferredoxin domain-containing protein [Blastocatellia bacterium]|nr:(2Fe-2S) ferredoxin domain-containing protein [Blastocatellia bacterium]